MNRLISLSFPISSKTPLYGGESNVNIVATRSMDNGDTSNQLFLHIPNHCSTHIDFPSHFCKNGKTLNDYQPAYWIFNKVGFLEIPLEHITNKISVLDSKIEILIIKTGFGTYRGKEEYWRNQPLIEPSWAFLLKKKFPNLRVFGFDMISLSSWQNREKGREAHKAFLCKKDILVLEDMNLRELQYTPKKVIVAPLLIDKADGSPCNVYAYV